MGDVVCRTGQFSEAEKCLKEVVTKRDDEVWASTCFFLAMTCQQLGRRDEARQWLDKGIAKSERETDWQERVVNRVLRQEAEAMLSSDLKPFDPPKAEAALTAPAGLDAR